VGHDIKMWLTTTPRGVLHWLYGIFVKKELPEEVIEALVQGGYAADPSVLLAWHRASTWDNRSHLNPLYFAMLLATYQGRWREQEMEGKFVSFEGLVYDNFDPEFHIVERPRMEQWWPRWRVIDFGYKNPFVCQWWTRDPDGRYFMYREIYRTQRLVSEHAAQIKYYSDGETFNDPAICDWDAEDRATLEDAGIPTQPAVKDISLGIQTVHRMLAFDDNKRSDLYFVRDALVERDPLLEANEQPLSTIDEFQRYAWPEDKEGKVRKEQPLDLFNHGMDDTRYFAMHVEGGGSTGIEIGPNPLAGYRG
jgi:phage terminase large subunit